MKLLETKQLNNYLIAIYNLIPYHAEWIYLNFQPLEHVEVVDRGSSYLFNLTRKLF